VLRVTSFLAILVMAGTAAAAPPTERRLAVREYVNRMKAEAARSSGSRETIGGRMDGGSVHL